MKAIVPILTVLAAAPVLAFSYAPFAGLGDAPPVPEVIAGGLSGLVKVRLVRERDGTLVDHVTKPEVLVLEAYFTTDLAVPDAPIEIDCWIVYRDPHGGAKLMRGPFACYEGRAEDGRGRWQKLNVDYRFLPEKTDMNGTSGMAIVFSPPSVTNEGIIATYDWQGGVEAEADQ